MTLPACNQNHVTNKTDAALDALPDAAQQVHGSYMYFHPHCYKVTNTAPEWCRFKASLGLAAYNSGELCLQGSIPTDL